MLMVSAAGQLSSRGPVASRGGRAVVWLVEPEPGCFALTEDDDGTPILLVRHMNLRILLCFLSVAAVVARDLRVYRSYCTTAKALNPRYVHLPLTCH